MPLSPRLAVGSPRYLRRAVPLLLFAFLLVPGCQRLKPVDTTVFDRMGMGYADIQTLRGLHLDNNEVNEIVEVKQAGLSDDGCVALVRLARGRNEKFHAGEDVADLLKAGMAEPSILELDQLNVLGLWTGEAETMRLAGLSDRIILEAAHRHAEGRTVLSGASLANFKNAGMREPALLELVRRGVPDSDARTIVSLKRRGWSDNAILRRYSGSAR
ncbi:MAG TPA: hypothetical protein VJN21_02755 [Candidatus Acidoferrales bacterium]|nr:hypothetical protein [Candidatus Acidoferrales bacterium]